MMRWGERRRSPVAKGFDAVGILLVRQLGVKLEQMRDDAFFVAAEIDAVGGFYRCIGALCAVSKSAGILSGS